MRSPCIRALHGAGQGHRQTTRMGNKSQGGVFAPIVVVARKAIGDKQFNQLRGTAISKHSQGELQTLHSAWVPKVQSTNPIKHH